MTKLNVQFKLGENSGGGSWEAGERGDMRERRKDAILRCISGGKGWVLPQLNMPEERRGRET